MWLPRGLLEWILENRSLLLCCFVTVEVVVASAVFYVLDGYNAKNAKRFKTAQTLASKASGSLFELPAFRGKEIPTPFENTTWRLTKYEQFKLSIVCVTLFPIRFLGVFVTFFGTCLIVAVLVKLGLLRAARATTACGCRMMLLVFGFFWIRVKGRQAPGVGVLVANHSTFLDGMTLVAFSKSRIFAEKSNFQSGPLQVFAKALNIVLFDRSGQESRREARRIMQSAAGDAVAGKSSPILVFPTGTTTNSSAMITFKDGAFAPGLPVQPAVLRWKFRHCDPAWVFSGPGTAMLTFRLLCQFVNFLEIEFLPVCTPTEEEKKEPHKFARRVQLQVAEAMGVPVTEHSVEDLQLQFAAVKANLPAEAGVVGFSALKEVFSVDANQIKEQMNVFKEMDRNGLGVVNFDQFIDCFRRGFHEPSQEQTALLKTFFEELTAGSGTLDFRKFLIGLALVNENEKQQGDESKNASPTTLPIEKYRKEIYVKLAFAAFAAEKNDRISWREFKELWNWLHPDGITAPAEDPSTAQGPRTPRESVPSPPRRRWAQCFGGFFREGSKEVPNSAAQEVASSAERVFEEISGSKLQDVTDGSSEYLTWEMFSAYADKKSDFAHHLRQAFFNRVAQELGAPKR